MANPGDKYRPSNGTEGMIFEDRFCNHCINEKFLHTQNPGDKCCDILTGAYFDGDYPNEWIYDQNCKPTCTAYKHWDWGGDDDGNINEPPPNDPYDPNQLVMPFITNEILQNHKQKELC